MSSPCAKNEKAKKCELKGRKIEEVNFCGVASSVRTLANSTAKITMEDPNIHIAENMVEPELLFMTEKLRVGFLIQVPPTMWLHIGHKFGRIPLEILTWYV